MDLNPQKDLFWPSMALLSFTASLYFGMLPGTGSTLLWLFFGALGMVFIIKGFPNVWNYFFWYALSYILVYTGIVISFVLAPHMGSGLFTGRWIVFSIGLGFLVAGYGVIGYLIYHMKKVRDRLCGVTDNGEIDFNLVKQGYVPMGLWAASSISFYTSSVLSAYAWKLWAFGEISPYVYGFFDLSAILFMLYALWVPQNKLDWRSYYRDFPTTFDSMMDVNFNNFLKSLTSIHRGNNGRSRHHRKKTKGNKVETIHSHTDRSQKPSEQKCPHCGGPIIKRTKSCPKCGAERKLTYCLKEESYIILCPHCDSYNRYGADKCERCGKPLSRLLPCPACGYKGEISRWK